MILVEIKPLILALIICGAAIMFVAALKTRKILNLFKIKSERDSWHLLYSLMLFFLGGYSLAAYLILTELHAIFPLLTGVVFFFGSLFVLLSVNIYYHSLFVTQEGYRQAKEKAEETLQKLQATQMQLVQNEKMLSLGQLVAGIAHEINNPVSFIYGNLEYAEQHFQDLLQLVDLYELTYSPLSPDLVPAMKEVDLEYLKSDLPQILKSMQIGTNRIIKIVSALRNFSRLDEARHKSVSLHEGIDSTLTILASRLKATSNFPAIEVIKEYGEIPLIECNPGELNQVFMNLLGNAIDAIRVRKASPEENRDANLREHTESNPGKIKIRTTLKDANWIGIIITDNGAGISDEVRQRIFDPFFTTKPLGQGTGLGLSISYQIVVEKHGGSLKCCSTLGQGTEFTIELPVCSPASPK